MSYSSYTPLPVVDPDTPADAEMDTFTSVDRAPGSQSNRDDDIDQKSTKSIVGLDDAVSGLVKFRAR